MAKKKKFYVVWEGMRPGVYRTWPECQAQIQGYSGARYKAFGSLAEAEAAFGGESSDYIGQGAARPAAGVQLSWKELEQGPVLPSWSVDAACSGNPGVLEYRGVVTETGEELFFRGPFASGTNNIGEFLAIVHALAMMEKQGTSLPIYTDSRTALAWIRNRRAKTTLARTEQNRSLFALVARAEKWLSEHEISTTLLKWDTRNWGEIPADFGRK